MIIIANKIVKFPRKLMTTEKDRYDELIQDVIDNFKERNEVTRYKTQRSNLKKLKNKPLIVNNIMNKINVSRIPQYIKERNELIVNLLVNGVSSKNIINLKVSEVENLNVDVKYKIQINDFISKYNLFNKDGLVFLNKNRKDAINNQIINKIKKIYISSNIKGEC